MSWPVIMHVCEAAYPLGVVQRAAYSLADTLAIEVSVEPGQVKLSIFPSQDQLTLPSARVRPLVLQHLNDFALRNHINRETVGLREVLARAALTGCGLPQ